MDFPSCQALCSLVSKNMFNSLKIPQGRKRVAGVDLRQSWKNGRNRKSLLKADRLGLVWMVVLMGAPPASAETLRPTQPNILFFFSDDHSQQAIGAYGSKIATTPNIDRIANSGVTFTSSFVANSICTPSRATLLTGLHSHKNGARTLGASLPVQQTLPKLLKAAGYSTGIIGKWHLKRNVSNPTSAGFETWDILNDQGNYYSPDFYNQNGVHTKVTGSFVSDVTTSKALNWLNNRDVNKPFFLMVNHKATHQTWTPSPAQMADTATFAASEATDLYEPAVLWDDYSTHNAINPLRSTFVDRTPANLRGQTLKEYNRMTADQKTQFKAVYQWRRDFWDANKGSWSRVLGGPGHEALRRFRYNCFVKDYVRAGDTIDQSVGQILDYLEANNLDDNTIVIYSSDQGYFLGEHGYYEKRMMYEESFSNPLIMQWKANTKITPGSKVDGLVQNIDYAPSLLEAAGVGIPADKPMQGLSFLTLMEQSPGEDSILWRDALYYHYSQNDSYSAAAPPHYGVRTDRYKLIYFYKKNVWEMFDLQSDPTEVEDRYWSFNTNPRTHNIVVALKTRLLELRAHYEDNEGGSFAITDIEAAQPSVPAVINHGNAGSGSFDLTHENLSGATYQIMESSDLQTWVNFGNTFAGNGVGDYTHHLNVLEPRRFFRVYRTAGPLPPVAPSVSLSGAFSVAAPYTVNVTFSESVTGLSASDFTVTNGIASVVSGSGADYTVIITPTAYGDVLVTLPADTVTDENDSLMNTLSNALVTSYGESLSTTPVTNGLYFQLIADELALSDGAAVPSWTDQVSSNVLTGSGATYHTDFSNGHAAVRFTTAGTLSDTSLNATGLPDTDNVTLFLVGKVLSYTNAQRYFMFSQTGATNDRLRIASSRTTDNWATRVGAGGGIPSSIPVTTTDLNLFTVVSGKTGGNDVSLMLNDSSVVTGSSGNGLSMGKVQLSSNLNADIAEVLIYNRTLSDAEITQVNNYLSAKYAP